MRYVDLILRAAKREREPKSFAVIAEGGSSPSVSEVLAQELSRRTGLHISPEDVHSVAQVYSVSFRGFAPEDIVEYILGQESKGELDPQEILISTLGSFSPYFTPFPCPIPGRKEIMMAGLALRKVLDVLKILAPDLPERVNQFCEALNNVKGEFYMKYQLARNLTMHAVKDYPRLLSYMGSLHEEMARNGPWITLWYDPDFVNLESWEEQWELAQKAKELLREDVPHGVYRIGTLQDGTPLIISISVPPGFRVVAEAMIGDFKICVPETPQAFELARSFPEVPLGSPTFNVLILSPRLKEANLGKLSIASPVGLFVSDVQESRHGHCGAIAVSAEGGMMGTGLAGGGTTSVSYPSAAFILRGVSQARAQKGESYPVDPLAALILASDNVKPDILLHLTPNEQKIMTTYSPRLEQVKALWQQDPFEALRFALEEGLRPFYGHEAPEKARYYGEQLKDYLSSPEELAQKLAQVLRGEL